MAIASWSECACNCVGTGGGSEVLSDDNEHARRRLEFASAQLYVCVLQEAADMWASVRSKDRIAKFVTIDLEDPLGNGFLDAHGSWWASSHLSRSERKAIQEVVIDGNEKIATKCSTLAPAHAGRPRKDGKVKQRNNGWFMAVDPSTGLIIEEMLGPENHKVAFAAVKNAIKLAPKLDCVVYDRTCITLEKAKKDESLNSIKCWAVDRFHAGRHSDTCPCSPAVVHRIDRRLKGVNASIAEQTFAWFRTYVGTFNTMNARGSTYACSPLATTT